MGEEGSAGCPSHPLSNPLLRPTEALAQPLCRVRLSQGAESPSLTSRGQRHGSLPRCWGRGGTLLTLAWFEKPAYAPGKLHRLKK